MASEGEGAVGLRSGEGHGGPSGDSAPVEAVEDLLAGVEALRAQVGRRVLGQEAVVEETLLTLLAGGHALLEGVPGLAKTLLVRTLAQGMELEFRRIQFTPDLMPGDVTGTEVLNEERGSGRRELRFMPGPVFTQILLADEINRAPPKTQAALLEAMQEGHVTAAGTTRPLPSPFLVLATQNPIEQEGTYPLPEAQLDRFLLKIRVPYPEAGTERDILAATTGEARVPVEAVLDGPSILELRRAVRRVAASDPVLDYVVRLVRGTRPDTPDGVPDVVEWLRWGAGPRAGQALVLVGKARAILDGRFHLAPEDVRAVAPAVLRHRLLPSFRAEAEGFTPDRLVERLLAQVPAPRSGLE